MPLRFTVSASMAAFPAPVEAMSFRLGRRSSSSAVNRGSLPHDAENIKGKQASSERLQLGDMVLKYGDVRSIAEHPPIGALKRHILVIVQNPVGSEEANSCPNRPVRNPN